MASIRLNKSIIYVWLHNDPCLLCKKSMGNYHNTSKEMRSFGFGLHVLQKTSRWFKCASICGPLTFVVFLHCFFEKKPQKKHSSLIPAVR